jgi:two-component system, sensor histidine kinase YesM
MKAGSENKRIKLFHSIGFELLVFYLSISIIILAVGSFLIYNSTITMLQKRSEEYILEQFKQSEYNIQSLANEVDGLSRMLSLDSDIQKLLQAPGIDDSYESISMQIAAINKMKNEYLNGINQINSIYFFTKNGGFGTSQNKTIKFLADNSHVFYTSGMFDRAMKAFPELIWNAGITNDWFYNSGSVGGDYIFSFAKAARPLLSPNCTSVIVFNVDESSICNTYSRFAATGSGNMYIMDSQGIVISSIHKEDIGKKSAFVPGADFKSFTPNSGEKKELVVYYRLKDAKSKDTDWYIVRETPFGIFQSDITVFRNIAVFVFVISVLLIVVASVFSMKRITGPLSSLTARMSDIGKGNLGITIDTIPKNELGLVTMRFNEMSLDIRELMQRNAQVERERNELEMEALQYQINPHFLFNTLNMIKWMAAVVKAENIMDSTTALINILHPLYNNTDSMWTLADEIKCLENYIVIMNWRFKYKIVFKFDIPENMADNQIIKFILQPVIENSVTHGIGEQNSRIEIVVCGKETEKGILIMVTDNGVGISGDSLAALMKSLDISVNRNMKGKKNNIGLCNVNRRIKLNFGDGYGVRIESRVGEGTIVFIELPKL